jgi:hypothetical protein
MHKVTIKAQPPTAITATAQQLSASIEFRTSSFGKCSLIRWRKILIEIRFIPLDESIEPPKRLQVIAGPQSNTLLVSWEQASPAASARGYRVLVDGRQLQDVTNPSSTFDFLLRSHRYFSFFRRSHGGQYQCIATGTIAHSANTDRWWW